VTRLLSTVTACMILVSSIATAQERSSEVISLFDAKSLDGWRGRSDLWSVEDAMIVGRTSAEQPISKNTFLIWDGDLPNDFELLATYQIESGNSGIQYRSRVLDEKEFVVGGYQADIEATNRFTGINYEEKGRGILAERGQRVTIAEDGTKKVEQFGDAAEIAKSFRTEGWNSYRIVAKGNRLQHYINEILTCEVIDGQTDKAATSGVVALQLHVGPPMVVRFRDITVRELKD
jgi:hypothetical protein